MDERVARLKTPEECEQFIINVQERLPELAQQARRRAVELRAVLYGATHAVEREALEAVYAYEEILAKKHGKRVSASRTWQMIRSRGIIDAVEKAVTRRDATVGYETLAEMDMLDFAFEAVVLRHRTHFSEAAVRRSEQRMGDWQKAQEAVDT